MFACSDRRGALAGMLRGHHFAHENRGAGGAEDSELDGRYDHAHALLWTAPCDLSAASAAVAAYQQAVLEYGRRLRS